MQGATKNKVGTAPLMAQTIQNITKADNILSERRKQTIVGGVCVCGARKEVRGAVAHTLLEAEERYT